MTAHAAVVTTAIKGPLEVHQVPTVPPASGEVLVRVEWTASTPLDLHQNDGGLLVKHPQVMGGGLAGTVVQLGPDVKSLQIGETVFGYGWREQKEKSHQIFSTMPVYLLSKVCAVLFDDNCGSCRQRAASDPGRLYDATSRDAAQ